MAFEDAFEIEIPDEDAEKFRPSRTRSIIFRRSFKWIIAGPAALHAAGSAVLYR